MELILVLSTLVSFNLFIVEVGSRKFEPCELGSLLLQNGVGFDKVGDWVCLAHASSHYNSSIRAGPEKNSLYGIFLISARWFCYDEYQTINNDCHLNCSDLLDDDLEDDIKCAKIVYSQHGNTFNAFTPYKTHCSKNTSSENIKMYISQCDFANGSKPKILNSNKTVINFYQNDIKPGVEALSCDINGTLPINVTWEKNREPFNINDEFYKFETQVLGNNSLASCSSKIYFKQIMEPLSAENKLTSWKCIVKNIYGGSSKEFIMRIFDFPLPPLPPVKPNVWKQIIGIGISCTVTAIILVSILLGLYKCWWRERIQFTKEEVNEFVSGTTAPEDKVNNYSYMYERFRSDPYNKILEININDLSIGTKCLGKGAFGEVHLGKYKGNLVAVKTSQKANLSKTKNLEKSKEYIQSLLTEIKVLNFVSGHRNIVNLIGAYTKELRIGKVYVLTELCPYGSLESILKKYRLNKGNTYMEVGECSFPVHEYVNQESSNEAPLEVNHKVMINWAFQIASGMEWLGGKNVVHGDLATRNVLISVPDTVKITDFGLSIKLYDFKMKQVENSKMPWRWMPIEALKDGILSPLGDVWSFGICLWEIYSLALLPYAGISDLTIEIFNLLENGSLRNSQPPDTPNPIYEIMKNCWEGNPEQRPSFKLLREKLYLESKRFSAPTVYVDFNELNK